MRWSVSILSLVSLVGCSASWSHLDVDEDKYTIADGDCDNYNPDVGPGATEVWYNGIDENCDGNDGDHDGDGHLAIEVGGDDCWDNPDDIPDDFLALNGLAQPGAADVYPTAEDAWYDGVDSNCAGDDDFDQDLDGHAILDAAYEVRSTLPVDDCYDSTVQAYPYEAGDCEPTDNVLDPADVNPDVTDTWYDGTDANCDGADDFDQDEDGYGRCVECDDTDPALKPTGLPEGTWYDGDDDNCDGNDGDQDGDGYYIDGYETMTGVAVPEDFHPDEPDCWDNPASIPDEQLVVSSASQPGPEDVYPGAADEWYDSADADCAGNDDFDADYDGHASDNEQDRDGSTGDDCDDDDGSIHPGAAEVWYDGTDQDCDDRSDFDQDGDGYDSESYGGADCDDDAGGADINPGMTEDCGTATTDDDCDGSLNAEDAIDCDVYYFDGDGDNYGSTAYKCYCEATGSYTEDDDDDCDDGDATIHPTATEGTADGVDQDCDGKESCYDDDDGDTYGWTTSTESSTDLDCNDSGESPNADDCDDTRNTVYPGAAETVADGRDQSCDDIELCYVDADKDGYGTSATVASSDLTCTTSAGEADNTSDCNDANAAVNPGESETVANLTDDNCDGAELCYQDSDKDSYGSSTTVESTDVTCSTAAGEADDSDDCNDSISSVYPGATEVVANTRDDDCDGEELCYVDADKDTYGSDSTVVSTDLNCTTAASEADDSDDCNDASAVINPAASETVANSTDDNCDGVELCYQDNDKDGYGSTFTTESTDVNCTAGAAEADDSNDCDDANYYRNPGLTEVTANSLDDDCDGLEQCYVDADHDTYGSTSTTEASTNTSCADTGESSNATDCADSDSSRNPGKTEVTANSKDDDCDGYEQCYVDSDLDLYGGTTTAETSADTDCTDSGESQYNTDCSDSDSTRNPGKTETTANGKDDDCDGYEQCYVDSDLDTYGGTTTSETSADTDCSDSGESSNATDCADTDSTRNPGKTETTANSKDDDCDGYEQCYVDSDGDTYGTSTTSETSADTDCSDSGESQYSTDCNDASSSVSPIATEVTANSKDDDCDGKEQCYVDSDLDGYAGSTTAETSTDTDCTDSGEGTSSTDCNDSSASIKPGATEITDDGVDQDCDNLESCYVDGDGDGYGSTTATEGSSVLSCITTGYSTYNTDCSDSEAAVYPGAPEICDDGYNDCADSGTWAAADENNLVAFHNASTGAWSDVTSSFSAGTGGAPTTITASAAGDYYVCARTGDADWYAGLTISSLTVNVYGIASTGNAPTLSFNGKSGRVLQVTSANVGLHDLDLDGGTKSGGSGGVAYVSQSSTTTVYTTTFDNCSIHDGIATYGGGIAVAGNAAVDLIDSDVYSNAADYGGGIFLNGGGAVTCDGSLAGGAGIASNDGDIGGGAVYFFDATKGSFEAVDCDFEFNTVGGTTAEDVNGVGYSAPYNVGTVIDDNFVCSSTGCL